MITLIAQRGKFFIAISTTERFFSVVSPQVDFQVPFLREFFLATWIGTYMKSLLLQQVLVIFMNSQPSFASKALVAF
jgi:hypothetical protein